MSIQSLQSILRQIEYKIDISRFDNQFDSYMVQLQLLFNIPYFIFSTT